MEGESKYLYDRKTKALFVRLFSVAINQQSVIYLNKRKRKEYDAYVHMEYDTFKYSHPHAPSSTTQLHTVHTVRTVHTTHRDETIARLPDPDALSNLG